MDKNEWSAPSIRIKRILKERGLTQQDLANMLTGPSGDVVTLQNVKNLLNKPSMRTDTVKKIADALNVPMWQLFAAPEEVTEKSGGDDFVAMVRFHGDYYHADSIDELEKLMAGWKTIDFQKS